MRVLERCLEGVSRRNALKIGFDEHFVHEMG